MDHMIKNARQLRQQQKQLLQRQRELELAIRVDWNAVRKGMRPGNISNEAFSRWIIRQLMKRFLGADV
jgi:hypothetical protein